MFFGCYMDVTPRKLRLLARADVVNAEGRIGEADECVT
jgi:hypothetical protein